MATDEKGTVQLFQVRGASSSDEGPTPLFERQGRPYHKKGPSLLLTVDDLMEFEVSAKARQPAWWTERQAAARAEKRRDFEAEIDDVDESLEALKNEVARLLESNRALPG